jgi:ABC-type nitrate/sulfonate/bicarbonate transport system permease component
MRRSGAARLVTRLAVLGAALALWQGLSAAGLLSPAVFPSMTSTAAALGHQLASASLWTAVRVTLLAWAAGLLLGAVPAVAVGALLGLSRFAYRSAIPVIEFAKTIPVVAILPIALLLLGATLTMTCVLIAFGVFWPLIIQVSYGVRSIDRTVLDTARVLHVRGLRRFLVVILPSAAPFIATGLRVSAALALIIDVVAELIGGGGVGVQILTAEDSGPSAYSTMYAYIVLVGVLGVILAGGFTLAERRLLRWHESQRPRTGRNAG